MRIPTFSRYRSQKTVNDEHLVIDASLNNQCLASFSRRFWAYLFDLIMVFMVSLIIIGASLKLSAPELVSAFWNLFNSVEQDHSPGEPLYKLYAALENELPGILPDEIKAAVDNNDYTFFVELNDGHGLSLNGQFFSDEPSEVGSDGRITMRSDLAFSGFDMFFGGLSVFLGYFTVLIWLGKGKTPGKYLVRIRVVKLSGDKIRLVDAFERAGGYSASLSTGCLGFLDIFWSPNRQTMHDRISGTVVVRTVSPSNTGKE